MDLVLAAAMPAALFGAALVWNAWERRRATLAWLGALAFIVAAEIILIGARRPGVPELRLLDEWLTVLAGPLLFAYVSQSLSGRAPPPWVFLPIVLHSLGIAVAGTGLRDFVRIEHIVILQIAYTAAAVALYTFAAMGGTGARLPARPVLAVLGIACFVHAAQCVRLFGSGSESFQFLVPAVLAVVGIGAVLVSLTRSRVSTALSEEGAPARAVADAALWARIEQHMREARPWADPALDVAMLASQLGVTQNDISRALSSQANIGFYGYLMRFRVEEAKRLLKDPAEARYKAEGVGMQAGFGSRSAFYKAFREHTGLTPAEYRQRSAPPGDDGLPT